MINDPNRITQLVEAVLKKYEAGMRSRRTLNHGSVFEHCQEAINQIAIATYFIAEGSEPAAPVAIAWVKELPVPNGLYPMLINAVQELEEKYFPLLNFALSYPTSTSNLYLVKDSLMELFDNIEKNDENNAFSKSIPLWKYQL
ncbi:MAG: hypothetical protein KAS22_07000 [Candidatus Heimdallarchaeota archaeon]|nr:hypothetical protein [Candidatus Heimdallarchaeota archaeon]MCK5159527.1 hypothetical protein [Candidatus Heimdallarchaeota archaeon]